MLISAKAGFEQRVADLPEMKDRRRSARLKATYRPCCVMASKRTTVGIIKNFSHGGARIEIDADLVVGEEISYFWEERSCIRARVVWQNDNAYGVQHIERVSPSKQSLPSRSVRVPCQAEAQFWIGGGQYKAYVENISLGGMRIRGAKQLALGELISIRFCQLELSQVAVRWSHENRTGLRFAEQLTREKLAELLLDEKFGLSNVYFDKQAGQSNFE